MKDPQVHYHVFPRPLQEKTFDGVTFRDPPGPPDVTAAAQLGEGTLSKLKQLLLWLPEFCSSCCSSRWNIGGARF